MKILKRIFIDGLSGMAIGLFATLIIGTILEQIGTFVGGDIGHMIVMAASIAKVLTGAGIGIGVACKLGEETLVCASAASAGMIGAFATGLLDGSVITNGKITLSGPGEPLGAFVAAYIGIELGRIFVGRTKLDIILTPFITIFGGGVVGLTVGPYISDLMKQIGEMIRWGTEQQPFLMGIIVSVLMGMALTLPISSAALGVILNLSGIAAGAATVGCCAQMIGFATASFRDSWTNFNSCIKNDKQCDRIWNGNSRTCGADYGIQNNDYEYIPNNHHSYDSCYADHRPSISYLFYFRGNEEKRADQRWGYET